MLDFHYTRIIFQIHCSFELSVHQRILFKKKYYACHKTIKQHNCFHIHNNKKMFIKQQIRMISEVSCDTETGVTTAENAALSLQE